MTEDQATRIALKLLHHKDKPLSKTREKKIIQEVCEVGTKLGMKFSQENPRDSICWTGEVANIGGQPASNVIHEVAHFMVAHPDNRFLPDYALGAGVETKHYPIDTPEFVDPEVNQESWASLLGILWEYEFKMPVVATLNEHNWINNDPLSIYRSYIWHSDSVDRILQSLYKMGLITKTGKLRMRLRMA